MQDKTDLREIHYGGDYDSDFECDETENKLKQKNDLSKKEAPKPISKPNKQVFVEECSREEARKQKFDFLALDAYSRHKKLINEYILCYPGTTAKLKRNTCKDKTDHDVIRENHRFLWNEEDSTNTWQKQLAKKYYDKLFKEYCITDLSRYKENKIALRWRTEQEVIDGKGQFLCGNKHCKESEGLRSWEINFKYMEHDEKKNALVKLRLCHDCSFKLNFHHKRKEIKQQNKRPIVEENITKKLKLSADHGASSSQVSESVLDQAKAFDEGGKETANVEDEESQIWKLPLKEEVEVCRDDEFEEYLSSMLL